MGRRPPAPLALAHVLLLTTLMALAITTAPARGQSSTAPVELVVDGRAAGVIVTPAKPTRAQRFAAEELQIYLRKISGADVHILASDALPDGPAVVVGPHPSGQAIAERLAKAHPGDREAIAVVRQGQCLHLLGASETAICYAAWDWLESLGVQWILPTERGEFVPMRSTIAIEPLDKLDAPAMSLRGPNYWMTVDRGHPASSAVEEHGLQASVLFSLRMRQNNNVAFDPADEYPSIGSGHSYMYYLPPQRYYNDHPEWFNLIGGKRLSDGPWQVCFTNRQAAAEFAKNLMGDMASRVAAGVPIQRMLLWVSPNDRKAWCECAECQKLVDSDGSATSMVVNFANNVAEVVRKTYPEARIVFYAYDNYAHPPEHVRPGPGVCPQLVFWTANIAVGANHAHPMFSDANAKFRDYFAQYARMSDAIYAHEYYGHYTWFTPWPKLTQMAQDIPAMAREPRFCGMYSESHTHWGTQGPNFFLQPKLMWNPRLDVSKTLKDYYAAAYGPAAEHVEKYYSALQRKMDSLDYICGYATEIPLLLTPQVIRECDLHIQHVRELLPQMDPNMRWRAELLVSAWRASAQVGEAARLFVESRLPGDRRRILDLTDALEAFCDSEQGRWAFEYRIAHPAIQSIRGALAVPLDELPVGKTEYSEHFSYGGAIKFFATALDGFAPGIWGYSLPAKHRGVMQVPLRCAAGGTIGSLSLQLQTASTQDLDLAVALQAPDGSWSPLQRQGDDWLARPEELGGQEAALRITADNRSADSQTVLTGAKLSVTVENDR